MKTGILIQCSGLCKSFGRKEALKDVDLRIGRGKIIGLLGPNGSGKTTLIKLLNGLIRPTKGEILIDGVRDLHEVYSELSSGQRVFRRLDACERCARHVRGILQ